MKQAQKEWIRNKEEQLLWERTFFQRTHKELFFVIRITNDKELELFVRKLRLIYERDRYVLTALIKSFAKDDFIP